jgi:hypothetical protein
VEARTVLQVTRVQTIVSKILVLGPL